MADKLPTKRAAELSFDEWYGAIQDVMEEAQEGSGDARRSLTRLLDSPPAEARSRNWDKSVRTHLLRAATRDSDPSRHAIPERIAEMKRRLQGESSSSLEDLLIERILTCWTHVFVAEMRWVAKSDQDIPFQAGDYYQRALDRAHRRYVSALKALAEVRKLLGVSVEMVNVVQSQTVNVAGVNHASAGTKGSETTTARGRAPVAALRDDTMRSESGEGTSG